MLASIFSDSNFIPKIANLHQFRLYINDWKTVVKAQRKYLISLPAKQKATSAKNIDKLRKLVKTYSVEITDKENKKGFAENTVIYWQAALPLYLGMIKIKGKLKIFNISLYGE